MQCFKHSNQGPVKKKCHSAGSFVWPFSKQPLLSLQIFQFMNVALFTTTKKKKKKGISLEHYSLSHSVSPGFSIIFLNHHHPLFCGSHADKSLFPLSPNPLPKMNHFPFIPTLLSPVSPPLFFFSLLPQFSFFRPTSPCVCTCPAQ